MIVSTALSAALLLTGTVSTEPANGGPITVSPSHISITDLRPGTTGAVDVTVTNTGGVPAQVSVSGSLTSTQPVDDDDLLRVTLVGCAQPWAGVPAEPTAALIAPTCTDGEVPASSGSLPAVPLEAGETLHLLISAGLGERAGNGAQGQSWRATFDVRSLTSAPPAPPLLPLTGADVTRLGQAAVALLGGGVLAVALRSWKRKEKRS